jgi:hypothetical protein
MSDPVAMLLERGNPGDMPKQRSTGVFTTQYRRRWMS